MSEFLFKAVPHNEAIDFIKSKPIVSREVFDQLLPELQGRAFTITGAVPADVMQTVRDLIADLPAGRTWDAQKKLIADAISPYFVDPNASAEEQAAQVATAEAKAELLLRVHGQEAYQASSYQVMRRQQDTFPYWQYQTMGDARVRPAHAALDGLVIPASSPFWDTHFPPWDWGCRCIVIPISNVGLEHIAQKGDDSIVSGPRLQNLEHNNVIERFDLKTGTREHVDVSLPEGPNAFRFDPSQGVKIDIDLLRSKYSPEVWNTFEKWAQQTRLGDGRTVWNWLNDEAAAAPEAGGEVESTAAAGGARQSPVSAAIDVRVRNLAFRKEMEETLAAIDLAHDDGAIPDLKLISGRGRALGELILSEGTIQVKAKGPWRNLTLAHEVGHALDYYAIGEKLKFASEADPALAAWRDAIDRSSSIGLIQREPLLLNRSYFLTRREEFARSYAQYIAYKTGNATLLGDVERILKSQSHWRQWAWDDFAPIAKAFDDFFTEKGWQ